MNGREGHMAEQLEEVAGRPFQLHLQLRVRDHADTQFLRLPPTQAILAGSLDHIEQEGVLRPGLRVQNAQPGLTEVLSPDRVPVGETGVLAQGEGVNGPVRAHLPPGSHGRDGLQGKRVVAHQAFIDGRGKLGSHGGIDVARVQDEVYG